MKRLILAAAMLAASVARADDIVAYQVDGHAPASAREARVMALDEAFASAVTTALGELVAGDVRTARKSDLDREIVGRARLWVAKFSVTRDETIDNRRELTVSVRVDRDKLRARLAELSIETRDAAAEPGDPAFATRTATVLLRIATPSGVMADYGARAQPDLPGLTAITNLLRTGGFAVRRAPASGPNPSAETELPLSDEQAAQLANEANAEVVAIAGVKVGEAVPVRGMATTAALVTAHLRVVDRKDNKVVGQASGIAAATGDDAGYAIDRALLAAASDVFPPAPRKLDQPGTFRGADAPVTDPGIVLVRLPARTPLSLVLLEQKFLAGAKGVRSATLRRLSPAGWVIGVATGESVAQIARIAKKSPTAATRTSVKVAGDIVEVTLAEAP